MRVNKHLCGKHLCGRHLRGEHLCGRHLRGERSAASGRQAAQLPVDALLFAAPANCPLVVRR
jgi:hypothetical protein